MRQAVPIGLAVSVLLLTTSWASATEIIPGGSSGSDGLQLTGLYDLTFTNNLTFTDLWDCVASFENDTTDTYVTDQTNDMADTASDQENMGSDQIDSGSDESDQVDGESDQVQDGTAADAEWLGPTLADDVTDFVSTLLEGESLLGPSFDPGTLTDEVDALLPGAALIEPTTPAPEPATLLLFGSGVLVLVGRLKSRGRLRQDASGPKSRISR